MSTASTPIDAMCRHLALLLTSVDLATRVSPRPSQDATLSCLTLVRLSIKSDRVSLFSVENADSDAAGPLIVSRMARSTHLDDSVPIEAFFEPSSVALLLGCIQSGAIESVGPIDADEPFYRINQQAEPLIPIHAAFAPVMFDGQVVAVLEAARLNDGPFSEQELDALQTGSMVVSAAVFGLERERTVAALLREMLPEVHRPSDPQSTLSQRIEHWLRNRKNTVSERQALLLATSIAELTHSSGRALELAQTMITAIKNTFVREPRAAWSGSTLGDEHG